MWCKVTHCTGRASANTRPHQLRLGWPRDGDCYLMHVYSGGWSYPCCAVGSAGVTGSSHWKQLTNVCLVDHCHASAWKLEVEVIMHVLDHGLKINLVLGEGCNISLIGLMSANFSKHTLKPFMPQHDLSFSVIDRAYIMHLVNTCKHIDSWIFAICWTLHCVLNNESFWTSYNKCIPQVETSSGKCFLIWVHRISADKCVESLVDIIRQLHV